MNYFKIKGYDKKRRFSDVDGMLTKISIPGVIILMIFVFNYNDKELGSSVFFLFVLGVTGIAVFLSRFIWVVDTRNRLGTVCPEDIFTITITDTYIGFFETHIELTRIREISLTLETKTFEKDMSGNNDLIIKTDRNRKYHLGLIVTSVDEILAIEKAMASLKALKVNVDYVRTAPINF